MKKANNYITAIVTTPQSVWGEKSNKLRESDPLRVAHHFPLNDTDEDSVAVACHRVKLLMLRNPESEVRAAAWRITHAVTRGLQQFANMSVTRIGESVGSA